LNIDRAIRLVFDAIVATIILVILSYLWFLSYHVMDVCGWWFVMLLSIFTELASYRRLLVLERISGYGLGQLALYQVLRLLHCVLFRFLITRRYISDARWLTCSYNRLLRQVFSWLIVFLLNFHLLAYKHIILEILL